MKQRCHNLNSTQYKWYGARGISVCDRWRYNFDFFLADMSEAPSSKHTIERLDNDGNYEPGNCEWALQEVQQKNKRPRKDTVWLELNGVRKSVTEWAKATGLSKYTIYSRVNAGWPVADILTTVVLRR